MAFSAALRTEVKWHKFRFHFGAYHACQRVLLAVEHLRGLLTTTSHYHAYHLPRRSNLSCVQDENFSKKSHSFHEGVG